MKTLIGALMVLFVGALVIACGDDGTQGAANEVMTADVQELTSDGTESVDAVYASLPVMEEPEVAEVVGPELLLTGTANGLAKNAETLFVAAEAGLFALSPEGSKVVMAGETVASLNYNGQHWVLQDEMLRTVDGTVQVVPEFAAALTALAGHDGDIFVGTQGEGVWRLVDGDFEAVSPDWNVEALVATDFGLFAATDDGLHSFKGDRWHKRSLGDSSETLSRPTAIYYRYPFLYVGTGHELLTYDGGRWEHFAFGAGVTALGWHNARLYVGCDDGSLVTLEGTVLEQVIAPDSSPARAILRYDGRLYVATDQGLYRKRHGRFEPIELAEPTEREPETEPIASLL